MRTLGLGHFTFLDHPPAALIRLARETGYSFVGLRFHPIAAGQLHYCPQTSAEIHALRNTLRDEGIGVYDIETIIINEALDLDVLQRVIEAASEIGAERLNVCADDWDRGALIARFRTLCERAGNAGLGVDIECMAWRGINTPAKCLEVIEASGAENAAFLVDALHLYRCGGLPTDVRDMPSCRIASAQLCDAPSDPPAGEAALLAEARGGRLLPGEGGFDLKGLVSALPDHTVVSVELPMANDPRPPQLRASAIFHATMNLLEGNP